MNAHVNCELADFNPGALACVDVIDPLEHDRPSDEAFLATRRALCRVATVAAEAGARFQRDGTGIDPMAWMLAPRRMFDGEAPIDACLARGPFLRGVLVHGLALDLDMGAEEVDDLLDDEDDDAVGVHADHDLGHLPDVLGDQDGASQRADVRLFSATFASRAGSRTIHAFHASVASDRSEVAERLMRRFGPASADAVIVEGFDPGDPMTEALVAPAVAHTLALVAAAPGSPLAAGLDLNVEQRFID